MKTPTKKSNRSKLGNLGQKVSSRLNKENISWALYDWGNSAFATTVMAGFFPIFFKEYWSGGNSVTESTYYLGIANSVSSLALALMAPILGALADVSSKKKFYLGIFCTLGIITTGGLFFVGQGQWQLAILFYALAGFGFAGGNIFYDSLLPKVSSKQNLDFVSGLGYSLGYLGGGILFSVNVAMTLKPDWFGLENAAEAVKWSFISVALWWGLFSTPLFYNVKESDEENNDSIETSFSKCLKQLLQSFKEIKAKPSLLIFLIAYLFYIDGVNTIVKMAVDYGMSIGFESKNLIAALLITQFVGFPSAIAFGFLGEKWSAVSGIFVALAVYMGVTIWGYFLSDVQEFYYLAAVIGLVQGGIQALSRSYYASLIPEGQEAEYFGFFNMLGKFSAVLGPLLMGWVSLKTQNPRYSILVVIIFFIMGALFLRAHQSFKRKEESLRLS